MAQHTRTDQTVTQPRAKLLDLSLTQLIGGSLAAATAAALGSRLGVVGTIAGAAVGSVVTAIAASLYTNSMARAHRVIVTTWRPGRATAPVGAVDVRVSDPPAARREGRMKRLPTPRRSLASAAAVFVVAVAFLAGFQLSTGNPVTGTNVGTRQQAVPSTGDAVAVPPVGEAPAGHAGVAIEPARPTTGADATSEPGPTQAATATPTHTATVAPISPEPSVSAVNPAATSPGPQTPAAPVTPVPTG